MSNRGMEHSHAIENRLTDLEIKATFGEDLLDQLNQIIIRQQAQIDALTREMARLRDQLPDSSSGGFSRSGDDLPPHY